ncbi:hypothetical protein AD998_08265 [bacterium 336/3]|nr:hypothetical protein AD998_08265 [bacterium 336/3]
MFFQTKILQAQQPIFKHLTIELGLPSNMVYDCFQDSKGFMWFATDAGISKYNGQTFVNFTISDGLKDNENFQIREDSQGRIWFLSFNGGICYFQNGIIHNLDQKLREQNVKFNSTLVAFFEDSKKNIWLSSVIGFLCIKPDMSVSYFPQKSSVLKFWEEKGHVYFFTREGVHILNDNLKDYSIILQLSFSYQDIIKFHTSAISPNLDDTFFYGGYKINIKTGEVQEYFQKKERSLLRYCQTDDSQIWIGTSTGAYVMQKNKPFSFQKAILAKEAVTCIRKDRDNGFWFTTLNNGVFYTPSIEANKYTTQDGLLQNHISCITSDKNQNIWIGYHQFKISRFNNEKISHYDLHTPQYNYNTIHRINKMLNMGDSIWVLTDQTIINFKETKGVLVQYSDYQINARGFAITKDTLWVGGHRGVLFQNKTKKDFTLYSSYRVFSVSGSSNGTIWFSTHKGLHKLQNKKEKDFSQNPNLNVRISDILVDRNQQVWVATLGKGLVLLNNKDSVVNVWQEKHGLNSNIVKRIFLEQKNNTLWAITNKSVYKIENKKLEEVYALPIGYLNDVHVTNDTIWLASSEGLIKMPKREKSNYKKVVYLTDVWVNNQKIDFQNRPIQLSANQNNLRIGFTHVSFVDTDFYYRYKLKSNQKEWSYTNSNMIELSSLPPDEYQISIQVASSKNIEDTPITQFQFVIKPHFWQETWFFLLVGLLMTAGIGLIWHIKYRVAYQKMMLKGKIADLELRTLRAQMNPHFIFNILNTIQTFFLQQNIKAANKLLSQFSRLVRYVLDNTSQNFTPLQQEIEQLRNYIELEKSRFEFETEMIVEASLQTQNVQVPSMLIQPVVENAIIHGLSPKKENKKLLICFSQENQQIKIIIEDNGVGRKHKSNPSNHISRGLKLIEERLSFLNLHYHNQSKMVFHDLTDKDGNALGTKVEIYI